MNLINLKPGISVSGDPIVALKSEIKSNKYIYLIAGVHGDEVEGVYVLNELISELKDDDAIELPLIIIPTLNIDGLRNGTRGNSHGIDLNRNLPSSKWSPRYEDNKYNPGPAPLSEEENQYLDKLFNKYPPGLVISLHSWKRIINYDGNALGVAKLLSKYNNYHIANNLGYATPGSMGEYAVEKFNCPVLTLELPKLSEGIALKEIWEENGDALLHVLHSEILEHYLK